MQKFLIYALLTVTTIFFAACSNEPSVPVTAAQVIVADGKTVITHDGKISLTDEQKIFSPISGNVVATFFERGGNVVEGQALFKIGNATDESDLLKARAALGESMTALARALAEKNPAADEIQAEIDERRAVVQKLEDAAQNGIVYAPTAGKISVDTVQLGAHVTANETVLATIGSDNPVAVLFAVSDVEEHFLTTSDTLKVTLKFPDDTIYPREGTLNFAAADMIKAEFDNPTGRLALGDGVQVVIDGLKISGAMLIPERIIRHGDDGNFVFVVDSNKKAALKKISLGGKLGSYVIVNDGLKADDFVIVDGPKNLREGTPLSVNDK